MTISFYAAFFVLQLYARRRLSFEYSSNYVETLHVGTLFQFWMCLQLQFGRWFAWCWLLIRGSTAISRVEFGWVEREKVRYWCGWCLLKSESNYQPLGQMYTYFTDFDGVNVARCCVAHLSTLNPRTEKAASVLARFKDRSCFQYARVHLMAITPWILPSHYAIKAKIQTLLFSVHNRSRSQRARPNGSNRSKKKNIRNHAFWCCSIAGMECSHRITNSRSYWMA